jgi:O-antigen/teichoic acid export membrane protein
VAQFGLNAPAADRVQTLKGAIKARLNRASHSSLVLLTLKGLNSALNAISNFALAYVLVRAIGLHSYAVIASLLAIAALVLQSDLGITGLAFFQLRSHYLAETGQRAASQDDQDLVATIVAIYIAIGIFSAVFLGIALLTGLARVAAHRVAYLLIFAGAVCALPRMALRVAVNARDGFVWTEIVDLGRRTAILAATVAMLLGLSFVSYSALNLLSWALSIAALMWLARLSGFVPKSGALLRGTLLLRRELGGIRATVLFSLADFVITVFPYYLLAAMRDATAVVAFDMFYKVTRFAVLTYLIGAETVLPHQTRAAHDEDAAGLIRATAKGFLVGLLPLVSGIAAITLFGDKIFGVILNHNGIVTPVARLAICAMLVFLLIQTTCQIVLIGVGKFDELSRRACITLAGMAMISTLMVLFQWSSDTFTVAYVIVYGAGSLLYAECLYSSIRSLQGRNPQEHARIETASVAGTFTGGQRSPTEVEY